MALLPSGLASGPQEGSDDSCPIPLNVGTVDEFDWFLPLIFPRCAADYRPMIERSPVELLAIYKLTDYFQMHDDHNLCFNALTVHPDFDPALKLYSAQIHNMKEWREPAVAALLTIGTDNLSSEQKQWLHAFNVDGEPFYCLLAEKRFYLLRKRIELAEENAECVQHESCNKLRHVACTTTWRDFWAFGVIPHWLNSAEPCTEAHVRKILGDVKVHKLDIHPPCWYGMVSAMTEEREKPLPPPTLFREQRVLEKLVAKLG
ncbi:hypothetical protein EXIGLDRAFT_772642 [Exidia glandulosa HHB12029]|uniref:Uncharacterized protein n=1 Tax=Exidia glandulosa HHB12029 TaxID=1314781 RepID=A0A166A550_EXIGL|nr:hypothetical protein EXIGLDRAFT_772642 [Exidia glandulosa HHB12029]